MSNFSPESIRRRQWMLAGGLAALALGGVLMYFWAASPVPPPPMEERVRKTLATPGQLDERTVWRAQAEADLNSLVAGQKNTASIAARLEQENKDLRGKLSALEHVGLTAPPPAAVPSYAKETETGGPRNLPPAPGLKPSATSRAQAMSTPLDKAGFVNRGTPPDAPGVSAAPAGGQVTSSRGIVTLHWDAPATTSAGGQAGQQDAASGKGGGKEGATKSYLPAGSFAQADLLIGLDAPTGGQSQRNPQPVLLRLTDNAFLPSRVRAAVKDCFVVGAAYGDQSSERAYIRTESLSCIGRDGRAFDAKLSATVAGEDGKVGLRGKLVQKQGAILQQALLASVASGIGQAFRSSSTTQSVSALGSTATVQPGEEFKAGFGSGISNAADRLANYYISLAEKLHPVVEVDAGRRVTVMFTSGLHMDLPGGANNQEDDE